MNRNRSRNEQSSLRAALMKVHQSDLESQDLTVGACKQLRREIIAGDSEEPLPRCVTASVSSSAVTESDSNSR